MKFLQVCVLLAVFGTGLLAGTGDAKKVYDKLPQNFTVNREKPGNYTGTFTNLELYSEETAQYWDATVSAWKEYRKMVTTVDTAAGIVTVTELDSINNQLVYSSKYISYVTLNLSQNIFKINKSEYYQWNGSNWAMLARTTYTYDGNGYLIQTQGELQALPGMFFPFTRSTYTNNSVGNPVLMLTESYSVEGNTWFNDFKSEYSYKQGDDNYLLAEQQFQFESEQWVPLEKVSYTRNINLKPEEIIYECYVDGQLEKCNKYVYVYKPDGRSVETSTSYYWYESENNWVPSSLTTFYYDQSGKNDLTTIKSWDGVEWRSVSRTSYTYDAQDRIVEEHSERWVEIGFENYLRYITVYTPTSVEDKSTVLTFELKDNYPNPFNPSTRISYDLKEAALVTLSVYDMLGREVALLQNGYQQAGMYSYTFDAAGLASGVYVYKLNAGKSTVSKKMVLNK